MSDLNNFLKNKDILKLNKKLLRGDHPAGPLYAEIHLTDKCNLKCYFCNQYQYRKSGGNKFEWHLLKEIIIRLHKKGMQLIRFSGGGDPISFPFFSEVMNLISELGITISRFDTNGVGLTSEVSEMLIKNRIKTLHISLQAPTAESWAKVTGGRPSDFKKILKNVERFNQISRRLHDISVRFSFIIDAPTIKTLPMMVEISKLMGASFNIHDLNNYHYSKQFYRTIYPMLNKYLKTTNKGNLQYFTFSNIDKPKILIENESLIKKEMICLAPWFGLLVKPSGDVSPCCNIQFVVFGNIYKNDIIKIWNGKHFSAMRDKFQDIYFTDKLANKNESELDCLSFICNQDCPVLMGMYGFSKSKWDSIIS